MEECDRMWEERLVGGEACIIVHANLLREIDGPSKTAEFERTREKEREDKV